MANISVFNIEGNEVGSIERERTSFSALDIKENLVHMYVVNYYEQRSVRVLRVHLLVQKFLAAVKKPWKQKGTGNARQGLNQSTTVEGRRNRIRSKAKRL